MRQHFSALLAVTPFAVAAAPLLARRRWSFVAGACFVAALALWLRVGADGAFVAATLGVVAWFRDQRNRQRALIIEPESDDAQDEDEGDEYFEETDDGGDIDGVTEIDEAEATDDDDDPERRARS
ncbi:MAG: hypothetical protein LC785_00870 [Acidobacteria bacterium]|nr:hypothetical protein [Acidobacteriota bacterium]